MQPFPDAELGKAIMALLNSIDENKEAYRCRIPSVVCDHASLVETIMRNKYGEETNDRRADREEREKIMAMTPEKRDWYYLRKDLEAAVSFYFNLALACNPPESMQKIKRYLESHPE